MTHLELLHFVANAGGVVAVCPFPGIAVEEDGHNPVGRSRTAGIFQPGENICHQFVKFQTFLVISRGPLVQEGSLFQILLDILRDYFGHGLQRLTYFR
jgi:hypothetical protein